MPRTRRQTPLEASLSLLSLTADSVSSPPTQAGNGLDTDLSSLEYEEDDHQFEWEDEVDSVIPMVAIPSTPDGNDTAVLSTPPRPAQPNIHQGSPPVQPRISSRIIGRGGQKLLALSVTHTLTVSPRKKKATQKFKAKLSEKDLIILRYQKEHPGKLGQAVSFSNLTRKHMPQLNAELSASAISSDTFMPWIRQSLDQTRFQQYLETFWNRFNEGPNGVNEIFKRNAWYFGSKPEARGRTFTDSLLALSGTFTKELGYLSHGFLELTVATIKQPVVVVREKDLTLLTGSVDYTMTASGKLNTADLNAAEMENKMKKISKSMTAENSAEGIHQNREFQKLIRECGVSISICEQKRTQCAPTLLSFEPQVIGESAAIMIQFQLDIMPWCLTDGAEWVFGAVAKEDSKLKSYRLDSMRIDPDNPAANLYQVFQVLLFWVSAQRKDLRDLIKS